MKQILIFLLFPFFLTAQCPIRDCDKSYWSTSYEFNPTASNAETGDKCFMNVSGIYGVNLWGLVLNDWNHVSFWSTFPGHFNLVEPITIGKEQNIYFRGGATLLQYPTFKDGGSVYFNHHMNINTVIDVVGENYIYMPDTAQLIVHYPSTNVLYIGDTLKKTDDDYILILECGTNNGLTSGKSVYISPQVPKVCFEMFGMKGYMINNKKYLIIQ